MQAKGKDIIEQAGVAMNNAINAYQAYTKKRPTNIILLRNGITHLNYQYVLDEEIPRIQAGFEEIDPGYKPGLIYIGLEKRVSEKFFLDGQYRNPPFGAVVDTGVVSKFYDFYLMSQNVTRGTTTPIHYRIIYDTTGFPEGMVQEFVFGQCFNY